LPGLRREALRLRLAVSGNDGHADSVAVAAGDQRLDNLFGKPDFRGDGFGGEVVGVDFVFAQFVANP
jgi:hypothetical protein